MAISALAIAGCSQNEITENGQDTHPAIGFDVYTGVTTKGVETTTASMKTDGFGVLAIKASDTETYMTERKVTNAGSAWTYPTPAYWPANGDNLTFYSYAPHSKATLTNTSGTVTLADYTINGTFANMVDLVAATATPTTAGTNVDIEMKHILSRVALAAYTARDLATTGITVEVTDVSIIGSTANAGSKFYEKGTYTYSGTSAASGSWGSTAALAADYAVINGGNIGVTASTSAAADDLLGGAYLYCIPAATFTDGDIQIKIKYKTTVNAVATVKEETVKVPVGGSWAMGTAYKYTFKIAMNAIIFDNVTVDNTWADGSSTDLVTR